MRGLQKMVEEERYCADVLMQVSSVQEALRGVSRALLHNHLRHCAAEAIRSDDPERAEAMYEELIELVLPEHSARRVTRSTLRAGACPAPPCAWRPAP